MKKTLPGSMSRVLSYSLIAAIAVTVLGIALQHSRAAGFTSVIKSWMSGAPQIKLIPSAGPITVTATAGTPGPTDYATLGAAFTAINAGTHQGAITIAVVGDTTETATATLNASGSGSASYTSISIQPSGGAARTISGAITAGSPMIDFNGADNVTINGLNAGGNALTISNTTASATSGTSTIRFIGGATSNTITNSTILGSFSAAVTTNGGNIFFSTDANTANGNDNNTISNNNIGPAGANLPTKGVYMNGSTTTTAINNSGNTISGNNIFDYFGAAVSSTAIYVSSGNTDNNFTNNKFYQTATRTQTTGAQHSAIWIANTSGNNFLISGNTIGFASNTGTGTYNFVAVSSSSVLIPIFLSVGTTTATSVQGNTIAGIAMSGAGSGTSSSAAFRGIYVSSGLATVGDVTGNTIGSMSATGSITYTSSSSSASDVIAIFNFGSSNFVTTNNNVGGITASNSSTGASNVYGIRVNTSATATWTCNSNTIGGTVANSINSTTTATGTIVNGILNSNPIGTFTSNTIRNLTAAGGTGTTTSASVAGIVMNNTANNTIGQNTLFNLSNSHATAATVVTGIQFSGSGTTNVVERNLIYGLTASTNSASAEINGIRVGAGTTTYRNNMIAIGAGVANAIGAAASNSGTTGINGINEALGTDNFWHNSVYVGGTPTAGTGASYAFNGTQTINARSFRDNIFFNARGNSGATGKNYAIKINGTTANPSGLTINNNVYFANGSGGLFGFFNSADVANLSAWKTAVGQDTNSFESNPQYLDPTNATPNLHINPSASTLIEANGADVGVTDDFDGQTRASLTPVDIGADAGNFMGVDLSPPAINYTALANTTSTANRALMATITDATGVPTTGVGLPVIYYRKGSGAYSSTQGMFVSGSTYNFTLDYSLVAGGSVTVNDIIQYYVVAQDTASTPNVGSNPSTGASGFTANPPAASTPPTTPNSYQIVGAVNGTKTVCPSGCDYSSLTGASGLFADINSKVATSNLTIQINGDLTAEDGTNGLNPLAEEPTGSNFTVKIFPTGAARVISGTNSGALIRLNAADRVTIDGSIGGTGTDRSLTITNTNAGTSSAVVWMQSNGTDGATSNTIKNLNVAGSANTQTLFGIGSGSSTISTSSTGTNNNNNTIQNNNVSKTQFGIFSQGASAGSKNTGNTITQNLINTASPNNVAKTGILVGFENSIQITQNTVSGMSQTSSPDVFGISLGLTGISTSTFTGNEVTNATVSRNMIGTVLNTGTFSACGIGVAPATSGTNQIVNNTLTGVSANGTSGDFSVGILIGGGSGSTTRIYFNSVSMNGTQTGGSDKSYALAIGGSDPTVDVRDNVLYNTQNNGTGNNYAIAFGYSTFANLTSNFNDFFTATGATYFIGATASLSTPTSQATLANLQAATGKDANSLSTDPLFNAPASNLQPQTGSPVIDAGTSLSGTVVPYVDITGATRVDPPSMGAYESALDTAGPAITYTPLGNTTSTSNRTLMATITDTSGVPTTGTGLPVLYYRKGSGVYSSTQGMFVSGNTYSFTFNYSLVGGGSVMTGDTIQYFVAAQDNLNNVSVNPSTGASGLTANPPAASTPPTAPSSYMISMALAGSFNVGTGQTYTSLTNAGGVFEAINNNVLTNNVTINITSDLTSETGAVFLNQWAEEGAGNYTLTIKPTGAARTVSGTSTGSGLIVLNGADRVTIDGSTSGSSDRSLTITNGNTAATVIWIVSASASNGATNNTVKNCVISGNTGTIAVAGILTGSGVTLGNDAEAPNSNNTIQNNLIFRAQNALYLRGNSTTLDQNWTVTGNTFGAALAADKLTFRGMLIGNAQSFTVSQNSISGVSSSSSSTATMSGIQAVLKINGGTISRNQISDIKQNNTTGWGSNGIYLTASTTASNLTVVNNFVSDVASQGFNGVTSSDNGYGIMIDTGGGYNIYFNTVRMNTNQVAAGSITAAINIAAAVTLAGATDLRHDQTIKKSTDRQAGSVAAPAVNSIDLRDNILADTQTVGTRYAIYDASTSGAAVFSTINYNDYFAQNVGFLTSARVTLSDWQTATVQDANSKAVDPLLISSSDMHLQATSTLLSSGIVIGSVTNDIDGDPRPASSPDIGADEVVQAVAGTIPAGTYYNASAVNGNMLGGNVTITNQLTLNGTLDTAGNTLTIGCNGSIAGAAANSFVIGNVKKTYCGAGSFNFPVGTLNVSGQRPSGSVTGEYAPVLVNLTAATFPADFTVLTVKGAQPNINDPTKALQRYWVLTATGVTADLTFNYLDTDVPGTANENNFILVKYDGTFSKPLPQTVTPAANQASATGVTAFSDWTLAEPSAPTAVALNGFTAEGLAASPSLPKGGVLLRWQTGLEVANLGFNLYRDEAGRRARLTPNLIAGSALFVGASTTLGAGRSYLWRDTEAASAGAQYWLEEIDLNGNSHWHGPVSLLAGKLAADVYEPNSRTLGDLGGDQTNEATTRPVERMAAMKQATAAALIKQQALVASSTIKITVNREGWYQVKAAELLAAGLDGRVNPQTLQLFVDGREQPINLLTDKDGTLAGLEFYGTGIDSPYTGERAYLLVAGTSAGKRIQKVTSAGDAAPGGSFVATVERRDRTIYFPALRNGERENFFGAVIARDAVDQTLTLQHVNGTAATTAALEVALQGVTGQAHSVRVELNGNPVGTVSFANQAPAVAIFNVAHGLLREGANTVRLVPAGGASDISLVDYLRLSYQHYNTADSDGLRLTATAKQSLLIDGFSQPAVRVLDITDAGAVQELVGAVQPQKNGYGVSLLVQGVGERRLLALAGELAHPLKISASAASSWRQPSNGADLLIITRGDFAASLDPLVAQRRRQGLSVAVADIEAIYNEFSFGQKTPQAVKDFLYYAATSWKKKPRYVVLAGDASFDPKNYLGAGDFDLVPTKLFDSAYLETASDDWFVDFNNDGVPELAIGRLPARTAGEALTMAAKIARYDNQTPANTLLLMSDQNDTYDFAGGSADLRAVIPPEVRTQSLHRGDADDATTQARLITAINGGQRLVNYLGHGSVDLWRGNLLSTANVSSLTNSDRLTVFVMMSCLNGYFHDPALDSLGAALLKSERGGAVAVWASSGMTVPDAQAAMNLEAYRQLFSKQGLTIGEAMLRAKAVATNGDVRRTWILLGDPATKLR
jgi:Peptidase family C25